jgi:hypothetical protein
VQIDEQRLGLLQIDSVEAFGEPAADRSQEFASLLQFPLDPAKAAPYSSPRAGRDQRRSMAG